jgi:hypothetical protein
LDGYQTSIPKDSFSTQNRKSAASNQAMNSTISNFPIVQPINQTWTKEAIIGLVALLTAIVLAPAGWMLKSYFWGHGGSLYPMANRITFGMMILIVNQQA